MKHCSVIGCEKKHYAKGFCREHYLFLRKFKNPKKKKCNFPDCDKFLSIKRGSEYCYIHRQRILINKKYNLPEFSLLKYPHLKLKEYNPNYNGGNSEYPNHGSLKRVRKHKLLINPLCEDCGKEAKMTHHIDESKDNHKLKNLKSLCHKCHVKYHPIRGRNLYINKYGMSFAEIIVKTGLNRFFIRKLNKENTLRFLL